MLLNNFILKMMCYAGARRYGPVLESVITITEELAFQQAKEADQVLAKGKYLGRSPPSSLPLSPLPRPLHILVFGCHRKSSNICLYGVRCLERDDIEISV